ncbi:MAG: MG2 domain-containing protein [Polyangiaceae bacterium]
MKTATFKRVPRALRSVYLALVVIGGACAPGGATMPAVSPQGTLGLGGGGSDGAASEGPFRVVFSGPSGQASNTAEISVVFSRPLRELSLAGQEAPPPIVLDPPLAGRWQWVGTHALLFVPAAGPLPGATHVTVTVPATVKALDGSQLARAHKFEFETPRPSLSRSTPYDGQKGLEPKQKLDLRFNHPVDPQDLERFVQLHNHTRKTTVAIDLRRPDPAKPKWIQVVPRAPLAVHSSFELRLAAGWKGQEGPLTQKEARSVRFETYGPLRVERISCDQDTPHRKCAPGGSLGLGLSNPVRYRDVKRLLSVAPAVKLRWDSWRDDDDYVSYVDINAPFKAGASYTVNLAGALRDRYGQSLGRAHSERVEIDDVWPTVEIGIQGDILEASKRPITVGSVNVAEYELWSGALDKSQAVSLMREPSLEKQFTQLGRMVRRDVVKPASPTNRVHKRSIDPGALLGKHNRGVVAVGVSHLERGGERPRTRKDVRLVQVTDLAMTAKISRHGSVVWVTQLSSGKPVPGAKVEVHRAGLAALSATTDADGIARIAAKDFAPNLEGESKDAQAVLVVSEGSDWTVRSVQEFLDPWRMDVALDLSGQLRAYGLLFTERGLYRPGDTVQLKGILRRHTLTGNAVEAGTAFKLVVEDSEGEAIATKAVKTNRFGSFHTQVRLPRSASLGSYRVFANGMRDGSLSEHFEVAEYRPAEFKVDVESDRPAYVRGDEAKWVVRGDFLFGAPMANATTRYNVTRARTYFAPPGTEDFATAADAYYSDDEEEDLDHSLLSGGDKKLSAEGKLELGSRLALPSQRGPEVIHAEAEVTDLSRQAQSGSSSAIVHPAAFYVGIEQLKDFFVQAPGRVTPRLAAFTPQGKRLPGKRVEVELVKRRWSVARQDVGSEQLHSITKVVDTVVARCSVTTTSTPSGCGLDVPEGGYYVIVAKAKDERGNPALAALSFYGIGQGAMAWGDGDRRKLELALNKREFKVGDKARVLIKNPFPEAEALVTVERAGVYRAERRVLRGATPVVEVEVTEDLLPNAFVSVLVARGRSKPLTPGKVDVGAPDYRLGYAEIAVNNSSRRLKVDVTPSAAEVKPGAMIDVEIRTKNAAGKPQAAEVALYAVDEGVLTLSGYRTPDPLQVFTAPRALQVATLESREGLARLGLPDLGALGLDKGKDGGGGSEGGSVRKDFRQSAYFNPAVMTDASGRAKVSFKLPDSLTTYRLMAVAATLDDRYGFGESHVVTSKRLMARPALPRFLRTGDAAEAGVIITSKGLSDTQATVTANVRGLELVGEPTRQVSLAKGGSVEVRFPLRAHRAGDAKLGFFVSAGGEKDAVEVRRTVSVPAVSESVALYGQTDSARGEKLGDLSAMRRDVGELQLSVASTALVGLGGGIEQLVEYPYGCTEQLSSRLLPMLPLADLAKDFSLPLPKDSKQIAEKTVAEILSRQRGDGGFGYWPESQESSPWVSTYALFTLHHAKVRGHAVPSRAIDRAKAYVRRELERAPRDQIALTTAAFIVDVLAEVGAPDVGYMSRLHGERNRLPTFGKALLLHALAISHQKAELIEPLLKELEGQLRLDADAAYVSENLGDDYAVLMSSPARSSAMALRGLLAARANHPLASALAKGLLHARRGGSWRNTQETAYALLALDEYRKAQERQTPDFLARIWLSGAELASGRFEGRSAEAMRHVVAAKDIPAKAGGLLVFQKVGDGRMFYEARLRYVPRTLPSKPLDRGFYVQKTLRAVSPESLPTALRSLPERTQGRVDAGTLVLVDVIVVTPSPRELVVIDDPLPAGLEPVDARLATTASWLANLDEAGDAMEERSEEWQDDLAHGSAFLQSWYRRELRDDRVLFFVDAMDAGMYHYRYLARATTAGKFIVPPTKAEEMYTPEVFGRTGAVSLEVR